MASKNDDAEAKIIGMIDKFLTGNEILHKYDPDLSEHLYVGDKVHLIRIAAGPRTYWYGGGIAGDNTGEWDKEQVWDFLFKKFNDQEKRTAPKK